MLFKDTNSREVDDVTGVSYRDAESVMRQIEYAITERDGKGFGSIEACAEFAKSHHMDLLVYMKSQGNYRNCNHRGDTLSASDWKRMYRNILYYPVEDGEKTKRMVWNTDNYAAFNNARIYGEQSDGKYMPLYHRDYYTPTGHFDDKTATFNVARPIRTFAKQTGADTSFIHTLLRHIGGDCYPYLLSWLRAKMLTPTRKTEVVPIFVGAQGTGKTTFGEVICKALFGEENVLVTDQFDSTARFNADSADALVICIEEKTQEDRRNTSSSLKSRATATKIRKENKGVDPIYQDSYTDFVLTTNENVPLKFEDRGNQRRFMVMEVDPNFTVERSKKAAEVFASLYGYTAAGDKVCDGLIESRAVIEQFKQDLLNSKNCEGINYRNFPKTAAYKRCFEIPRTNEAVEIEVIIRSISPFIKASLEHKRVVPDISVMDEETGEEKKLLLTSFVQEPNSMQFVVRKSNKTDRVAICRQLIFCDQVSGKAYAHSSVERTLLDMKGWLLEEHGLVLLTDTNYPAQGFKNLSSKFRFSPASWFCLHDATTRQEDLEGEAQEREDRLLEIALAPDTGEDDVGDLIYDVYTSTREVPKRMGQRQRYNERFVYDPDGEFETLNELIPGCTDRRKENAQYLDTFLLEADVASTLIMQDEVNIIKQSVRSEQGIIPAERLYKRRLSLQDLEAERLFKEGTVCRVVYSGAKSMHLLVQVADAPSNLEEREWLDAYLKETLSDRLVFDKLTKDPTRLTRAPITKQRVKPLDSDEYGELLYGVELLPEGMFTSGTQKLLAVNWNSVYQINWRSIYDRWLHQPPAFYERKGRMLPTKQVYKDAAISLIENKDFFTSNRWQGLRQETFFPGYRLCRSMGYTHDELWSILIPQIEAYRKVKEIGYWRSRQHSDIIKSIDGEFDV